MSDFYYLASTLINTNDMLKVDFYYLASTLTNTDDKIDDCIRRRLVASNKLFIPCHGVTHKDDNFVPWQMDNLQKDF